MGSSIINQRFPSEASFFVCVCSEKKKQSFIMIDNEKRLYGTTRTLFGGCLLDTSNATAIGDGGVVLVDYYGHLSNVGEDDSSFYCLIKENFSYSVVEAYSSLQCIRLQPSLAPRVSANRSWLSNFARLFVDK